MGSVLLCERPADMAGPRPGEATASCPMGRGSSGAVLPPAPSQDFQPPEPGEIQYRRSESTLPQALEPVPERLRLHRVWSAIGSRYFILEIEVHKVGVRSKGQVTELMGHSRRGTQGSWIVLSAKYICLLIKTYHIKFEM